MLPSPASSPGAEPEDSGALGDADSHTSVSASPALSSAVAQRSAKAAAAGAGAGRAGGGGLAEAELELPTLAEEVSVLLGLDEERSVSSLELEGD